MTIRERLLEINELNIEHKLIQMNTVELYEYVDALNTFVDNFPAAESELRVALADNDYPSFSKHLVCIRDMLYDIYADELAAACEKQIKGLVNVKHEKAEAFMIYLLTTLSMLSIDIQMAVYKDDTEDVDESASTDESAAGNTSETSAASAKSILAVDDNTFFLDNLKATLQDTNYKLTCVTSGIAALRYLQNRRPDLFILDIEMPEMDGYELAHKIRAYRKKAPIIFLTGNATKEYVTKAIKAGAADFIVKPIDKKYVLERIEKHIGVVSEAVVSG
jgi:CheY-like chemotaxis protein